MFYLLLIYLVFFCYLKAFYEGNVHMEIYTMSLHCALFLPLSLWSKQLCADLMQ
jgi:hypothetical protein